MLTFDTFVAARALASEALAVELTTMLRSNGVDVLLLKGPVLDHWLYGPNEARSYGDLDLYVSPMQLAAAERLLQAQGFVNRYDGESPSFAEEHADTWVSEHHLLPVDLHRRIWGFRAPQVDVWDALWRGRQEMRLAAGSVATTGTAARALTSALHAAHHGPSVGRPIADLARAASLLDESTWEASAVLARQLEASEGLAAGLGLIGPEGARLRDALGLPSADPSVVRVTPRMWSMPATGEGFIRLHQAGSARARARLLLHEVFPSRDFMRTRPEYATLTRREPAGLQRAYVARWVQLVRGVPRGLKAAYAYQRVNKNRRDTDRG